MELQKGGHNLLTDQGVLVSDSHAIPISGDNNSVENQQTNFNLQDVFSSTHQSSRRDEATTQRHRAKLSSMLKDKEKEWSAIVEKKTGPLRLLDLPLDVLNEIVKEVTHTNDLASLALTHSAFHDLVTPHIYSRFDIVWPDTHIATEPRSGVDALTYGLATLVMNDETLGISKPKREAVGRGYCKMCSCNDCKLAKLSEETVMPAISQLRRGNRFSHYIRKFSIGNGPPEWVQEYLITKEGGKMLGTLVAIAIARMSNLETFIWDMPTGILRDVWISLSSQENREKDQMPKLEKVWVRLHDNREVAPELDSPRLPHNPGTTPNSSSLQLNATFRRSGSLFRESYDRIEHPNFSILPPLKSLSVLDIDEFAYLWEMSILIGKSRHTLRELRIGMASYLSGPDGWASSKMTDRIGPTGVIGTIMGMLFIYSDKNGYQVYELPKAASVMRPPVLEASTQADAGFLAPSAVFSYLYAYSSNEFQNTLSLAVPTEAKHNELVHTHSTNDPKNFNPLNPNLQTAHDVNEKLQLSPDEALDGQNKDRLRLEVLEIERVSLGLFVLHKTIDWSTISSLTLLSCGCHEQLWNTLRRNYTPQRTPPIISQGFSPQPVTSPRQSKSKSRHVSSDPHPPSSPVYQLSLKRIHTDAVSPALISFLKETLAPNSLEWLFLQDGRKYVSPVTLNCIHRGPIRRHRASLKKLMVDSAIGISDNTRSQKRKKWMFNRELLRFVTSGKMGCLKELTMTIDYNDWHFFLQRLPQIPHLCSLHIPFIADHIYGTHLNERELALQLVDVVAIRPEIKLLYVGLANTCFELLEVFDRDDSRYDSSTASPEPEPSGTSPMAGYTDDDVDEEANLAAEQSNTESDDGSSNFDDSDENVRGGEKKYPVLNLREILFYEDKVSIFKARHGRL